MPGTVTDLELAYEIRANTGLPSPVLTLYPVFLTLINPFGIRVPIVGTDVTGGSFQNPEVNRNITNNFLRNPLICGGYFDDFWLECSSCLAVFVDN